MTDADGPRNQEPEGINLLKVVSLKQVLVLIRALAAVAIVLHLAYFVAASMVHHNGPWAATYRLGTAAYAIATDFVLIGMAYIVGFFPKK
jgi:heme/copper-type cytochrome/quinol oxidase subunit 4